ncbi:uncharacterized protein Dyak_GE20010 [Drosophila yakuba]|uniref:Uncharacterized protein n=2 Tax=Drosophila yakuba TaxID=7245 RepID=B4PIF9_DROYA|nr:uncharacterized protein Dyak_GE20010 [Drosophila yakuba]
MRNQIDTSGDPENISSESEASSETDLCEDYDNITMWSDKQLKIIGHLTNFQSTLGSIRSSLDKTISIEKCCFYQDNMVELIIENVNAIGPDSENPDTQIQRSKDLSTNLKNIFSKIKKTVVDGFNSCCENLREAIENVKGEVEEKVKEISMKYKEMHTRSSTTNDGLQNKVKQLEGEIEAAKSRLEKLQQEMDKNSEKTNCCEELKQQMSVLDGKISTVKSEADSDIKKLDNQLQELTEKLRNQDKITDALKKKVEDGGEITKNIMDKTKKNCGNPNSSHDVQIQKEDLLDLKKRTENLQMLVASLTNKIGNFDINGSPTSLSVILNTCLKNNKKLSTIESVLREMIKKRNQTCSKASTEITKSNENCASDKQLEERIKALQNESKILDDERKNFPQCCQKIDKLHIQAVQITNALQSMNKTYNDQIQDNTNKIKSLKDGLDKALERVGQIDHSKINDGAQEQVKKLERKLDKAIISVEVLKETQDDFIKLMENSKNRKYSPNEMEKLRKDFDEFRLKILRELNEFEKKMLQEPSSDARKRESQLMQTNDNVRQNMDTLKNTIQLQDELKVKAQDEIQKRKTPSQNMLDCEKKCKEMDKFDKLINEIEDAKKRVQKHTQKKKPVKKPKRKPKPKPKPKPTRKRYKAIVGGIDFEPDGHKIHRRQRSVDRSERDENETEGEFSGSTIQDAFIQQCECHAQVSIASLLLVITCESAVTAVRNTHENGNIYNQIRAPPVKERCDDYNDIAKWIDEHIKLSAQLRKFQKDQIAVPSYFKKTPTSNTCNFYEESSLNRILEMVNRINKKSGAQVEKLISTGDMEKDVENVLPQINKVFAKGIKSCCKILAKLIEQHKVDLQEKLKDMPKKLIETEPGNLNENDAIKEKLGYIEKQFEDIKPLFQKVQKHSGDTEANTKCCNSLKVSIQALESKLNIIKCDGDNQSLKMQKQLKELKDKIREKGDLTNVFKKTLGQRSENINNILSICNKNCINKHVSMDPISFLDLEKIIENLQKLVDTLFTKLGGLDIINLKGTLNTCQDNNKTLTEIQSQIEYLRKQNSKTCSEGLPVGSELAIKKCASNEKLQNSILGLQNEIGILRNELTKFPECCQKMDDLSVYIGKLGDMMKKMNQTYNDHTNANSNLLNSIKEGLVESLKKLGKNPSHDNENVGNPARKLKKDLKKASLSLGFLKTKQGELLKVINEMQTSLYSPDEMNGLKKDLDEFRKDIDGKLRDLELKKQKKINDAQRLDTFNSEAIQELEKFIKKGLAPKELEMQIKDQTEEKVKKANEMHDCKQRCSKINTMNDLIDQVEDMEKIVK